MLNLSLGLSESALFDFRLVDLVFDDEADVSDVEDLFPFLESLRIFLDDVDEDSDVEAVSAPLGVGILDLIL